MRYENVSEAHVFCIWTWVFHRLRIHAKQNPSQAERRFHHWLAGPDTSLYSLCLSRLSTSIEHDSLCSWACHIHKWRHHCENQSNGVFDDNERNLCLKKNETKQNTVSWPSKIVSIAVLLLKTKPNTICWLFISKVNDWIGISDNVPPTWLCT